MRKKPFPQKPAGMSASIASSIAFDQYQQAREQADKESQERFRWAYLRYLEQKRLYQSSKINGYLAASPLHIPKPIVKASRGVPVLSGFHQPETVKDLRPFLDVTPIQLCPPCEESTKLDSPGETT